MEREAKSASPAHCRKCPSTKIARFDTSSRLSSRGNIPRRPLRQVIQAGHSTYKCMKPLSWLLNPFLRKERQNGTNHPHRSVQVSLQHLLDRPRTTFPGVRQTQDRMCQTRGKAIYAVYEGW